jgi:DNA-binding CsgD family transcriptional regulator
MVDPAHTPGNHSLIGRAAERATIDALVRDARSGVSGAVLIHGPAGIGKSALVQYALVTASDFTVARTAGVESEMGFSYAGISQAVVPLLPGIGALSRDQRAVVEGVLGRANHDQLDPFVVGLALLSLLAEVARGQSVLVVADDAQWLDEESTTVLSFVGRRLHAERVLLLVAARDAPEARRGFEGFGRLELAGVSAPEAQQLLASVATNPIDASVAERIIATTNGNPLALIELPASLTDDELRGAVPLRDPLPIDAHVADVFAQRARALKADARMVLLLAAAERVGDPALLRHAAATEDLSWEQAVASAEESGLVTFTPRVAFRHPLVRSAIYYSAAPAERRRAHAALAEALDGDGDADRRAWHLGAATLTPDERVASELEASAERARRRGGSSVAAEYLWRAAELTPDPERATERLLDAARGALTAGLVKRAQQMLDRATARGVGAEQVADAAWTQALVSFVGGEVRDAARLLADALSAVDPRHLELAIGAGVAAGATALDGGHLIDESTRQAIASGIRRIGEQCDIPCPMAELLTAIATRLADGPIAASQPLRTAVMAAATNPTRLQDSAGRHVHVVYFDAVAAACEVLDDGAWDDLTQEWAQLARRTGALAALPLALSFRSWLDILRGRPATAASYLAEIDDLVALTGTRGLLGTPSPAQVLLDAWRGNDEAARTGAQRMMQDGHERGQGVAIDHAYAALTVLELGAGHYEAALRATQRICDHDGAGIATLADLAEAAMRCRQPALARHATTQLSERVTAADTPWARGILLRARAITADDAEAEDHFRASLEDLSRCTVVTDVARTQLLYGEWLRRERRRRDAREPLHQALERFETMGATAFASRARTELAATGEHLRTRSAPLDLLTPQEAQIARLAAAGERNREIAAHLYITTSTVEYHLRKVFVKLGVSSRTQLAQVDLPA